jgi:predicted MFS family arabinose efflux permease
MLGPYGAVLSKPGAFAFSSAGLLARLPISSIPLGIVLLVEYKTDSYGTAGAVSAAFMLASAISSPILGRLTDQLGQRPVLLVGFAFFAAGIAGLVAAVQVEWGTPGPHAFAVVAGLAYPPIGAAIRARWTYVLKAGPMLHTAFSLEAVVDEIIFMTGPILVTVLTIQVNELAGLLTVMVVATLGGLWLASMRKTAPPARAASPSRKKDPIGWLWISSMVVVAACLGSLFGANEVVTVAFAEEHGHPGLTGVLLAIWATGSLIAGIVTGAVQWKSPPLVRYRYGALCLALVMIPLPFVDSLWVFAICLFVAGFAISPTMVATMSLVEECVPASRLTEGITWFSTGIALGVAPGAAIAGLLIDEYGTSTAFLVPIASGGIAAAFAWLVAPRRQPVHVLGEV